MKKLAILLTGILALAGGPQAAPAARPDWAYAVPTSGDAEPPVRDNGRLLSLPGANRQFTYNKI